MSRNPEQKLSPREITAIEKQKSRFPFKTTSHYSGLIDFDDPNDPLRIQAVPSDHEEIFLDDESADPLSEFQFNPVQDLIHKYSSRVLWLISNECPMHCRFCFRRCHPRLGSGSKDSLSPTATNAIWDYLKTHPLITELILSGGDPLMLNPESISNVVNQAKIIPNLRLLRIHSRCPVADPQRLKQFDFLRSDSDLLLRLVVHINHPNEISREMIRAISEWTRRGIPVLSQTVLLRGVNDHIDILTKLFMELICSGVQPYYLHHLDHVKGTSHFRVNINIGRQLIQELSKRLPGYAIPRFVRDIPGHNSKTFL